MSVFPEMDRAEIEIEKIKLEALQKKLKEVEPLYQALTVEISSIKDGIKRMEERLK